MKCIRLIFALLSVSIAVWVLISAFRAYRSTPDQIKLVEYDESTGQIFETVRADIERFFQMGVLIFGGLWTLAVVDKGHHVRRSDLEETVMFVAATLIFVTCFYFLQDYDNVLKQVVWDTRTLLIGGRKQFPDLLHSPFLDLHSKVMVRSFYSGLVVSALTAFSLCRLRQS